MDCPTVRHRIARLAMQNPTEETCGFVLTDRRVIAVDNVAGDRRRQFEIRAEDYAQWEEQIGGVWHSHPAGPCRFSPADVRGCKASGLRWWLFHQPSRQVIYADPTGAGDYVGREWVYGINDCFGLVINWLERELGFTFPDVDRYEDEPRPSRQVLEAFPPLMRASGLEEVTDGVRYGDVLFMQVNSPVPNHCAVLVDQGRNHILHHLIGRYSSVDYYGSYWRNVTHSVWRVKCS